MARLLGPTRRRSNAWLLLPLAVAGLGYTLFSSPTLGALLHAILGRVLPHL